MNIKISEFNLKKLVNDAGSTLSRVVQLTEEKLGTAEKTELNSHLEDLCTRADNTKAWSEKILRNVEAVTTPNPGNRAEDYLFEKIEKKKPTRLTNLEYLGLDMIQAGADLDGAYGSTLTKVGQTQQKLGIAERKMIGTSFVHYIQPMRTFLDSDMKQFTREKLQLESLRFDLDACKGRVRKARSMLGQQPSNGNSPEAVLDQAERDLQRAQVDFDKQASVLKIHLETMGDIHKKQERQLLMLVQTQATFYKECALLLDELQRDLNKQGGEIMYNSLGLDPNPKPVDSNAATDSGSKKAQNVQRAKVLCSYDAIDATELDLTANDIISVQECVPPHPDFMFCDQISQKGLVPRAFLEIIIDNEAN